MKTMFNYLYYKLHEATLKGSLRDTPHLMASVFLGGLIGLNVLVTYFLLVKLEVLPYILRSKTDGSWFIAIFIALFWLYFTKDKRNAIIEKYRGEDDNARIRGNVIVGMYAVLSFLSIFLVAFFRPGKF